MKVINLRGKMRQIIISGIKRDTKKVIVLFLIEDILNCIVYISVLEVLVEASTDQSSLDGNELKRNHESDQIIKLNIYIKESVQENISSKIMCISLK